MQIIEILGTGCSTCLKMEQLAEKAALELGIDYEIKKVTDVDEILSHGVMYTPALVVNGAVKIAGKVPSIDIVKNMISDS